MEYSRESFNALLERNVKLEQLLKEKEEYSHVDRLNETQKISQIGSWSWDLVDNTVEWSEMMYTILGLEPNIEAPSYELALQHVHDEDKENYEKVLGAAVDNKQSYYLENRIVKEDKSIVRVLSRGTCMCNEENELIRMVGTVQDVTLFIQLVTSNKQLEQFANVLSHDFKTPIRTIVSFIGLLKKKSFEKFTEEEKEYFSFIETGSRKLYDLVNDILEYSKLSSPGLRPSKILMKEFLESIIFDLKINLHEKNGVISVGKMPEYIMADRIKIRQVFQNLISNAIKYNDPEIPPRIEIYSEEDEDQYVFYISDNGLGIKAEYMAQVFEPYVRLNNEESTSGSGLGLSICKRIVELHQGKINFSSENENGTSFYFSIPKTQHTQL